MNTSFADIVNNDMRIFYGTQSLSKQDLNESVVREIKALGNLVDPDFIKQISEDNGISFNRIYQYELAVSCDVNVVESYKATKREEYVASFDVKEDAWGNVSLEPNKKVEKTHSSGNMGYDYKERVKGVRCLLYPSGNSNKYVGLTFDELEWVKDFSRTEIEGFSRDGSSGYESLPEIKGFFSEITRAITSYRSMKPESDKASGELYSEISSKPNWSCDYTKFSSAKITKFHAAVARVSVFGYIVQASYKGKVYKIELDACGNIVLQKSSFPMPRRLYASCCSNEEIHNIFLTMLQREGDRVDPNFLQYVSNIDNVEISACPNVFVVSRVCVDLEATSSGKTTSKRVGYFFSSATNGDGKSFKMNAFEDTDKIVEALRDKSFITDSESKALKQCVIPSQNFLDMCKGVKINKKDDSLSEEREELSQNYSQNDIVTYSLKKNQEEFAYIYKMTSCCVTATYNGETYTNVIDLDNSESTIRGYFEYKRSAKAVDSLVDSLKDRLFRNKIRGKSITFSTIAVALLLLAVWQSVSFWWLGRYDFINTGTQKTVMHIVVWVRIISVFISTLGLGSMLRTIRLQKEIVQLYQKHQREHISNAQEIRRITVLNDEDLNTEADALGAFVWAVIGTVLFLIPFVIFIF